MNRLWVAAAFWAAGCGRLGFDAHDARNNSGGSADGADSDVPCVLGPFGTPQLVPNINAFGTGNDDWSAAITPDDLAIYFYSFRGPLPPAPDIWVGRRSDPAAAFGAATLMSDVSTAKNDISPRVTADELMIVFASDRTGTLGSTDLFEATRATTAVPFGAAVDLPVVNSANDEDTLWLSPDGLHIYFSSNRGASVDLFSSERTSRTAPFTAPQLVTGASSTTDPDRTPWLTTDQLEIYFSSLRPSGMGGYDIWRASRPSATAAFGPAENVTELNSAQDDYAPSLSSDGRRIYFNYNASLLGGADANIYVAERGCL